MAVNSKREMGTINGSLRFSLSATNKGKEVKSRRSSKRRKSKNPGQLYKKKKKKKIGGKSPVKGKREFYTGGHSTSWLTWTAGKEGKKKHDKGGVFIDRNFQTVGWVKRQIKRKKKGQCNAPTGTWQVDVPGSKREHLPQATKANKNKHFPSSFY